MNTQKRKWVGVVGPACSGKSTAVEGMRMVEGVFVVPEPLPVEELAAVSDVSPSPNAGFDLQRAIISGKFAAAQAAPPERLLLFDRTLAEDSEVFFPIHRNRLGSLGDSHVVRLLEECRDYESALGAPLLLIELRAPEPVLRKRFETVERPPWLLSTLSDQIALYEQWLATDSSTRLTVDTDVCDLETVASLCRSVVSVLARNGSLDEALAVALHGDHTGIELVNNQGTNFGSGIDA